MGTFSFIISPSSVRLSVFVMILIDLTLFQATNCLIRFSWVFYIPKRGPNTLIRTFAVAFLEMLRRVQWNFCKHLWGRREPVEFRAKIFS